MTVILLGCGGHAAVVADALRTMGTPVTAIVGPEPPTGGLADLPYWGGEEVLQNWQGAPPSLANGIGGLRPENARRRVFERLQAFRFPPVVHAAAIVAADVHLDAGCQIMAGAVIQPGTRLGANALVNTGACVDHDCVIGPHVHLAPGSVLSGGVTVGEGSHVGTGATVIQQVRIGVGCTVAAGAVVVCDVADGITVMGVPARPRSHVA